MYKKGDFHIHSTESDGDLKPGEIVLLAKDRHLDIIAITDHNTVSGNNQAIKVGNIYGVKVIPGIEVSTRYKGNRVHILGYFPDDRYNDEEFKKNLSFIRKGKFKLCAINSKGKLSYKSEGGKLSTSAGIEFLHYYGAKVVLAHPVVLKREIFLKLMEFDFDGIEAKYYKNKEEETEYYLKIAEDKGLFYTAGSDFHCLNKDDFKHGALGQIYLEEEEIDIFINKLIEK